MHSAFGRNAGLTREQIESLQRLELDGFERREYIALNWVRQFLTCPGGVPAGVEEEFTSTFTLKEQTCIKASMKSVFCINLLISTTMQGKLGGRIMGMVCGE